MIGQWHFLEVFHGTLNHLQISGNGRAGELSQRIVISIVPLILHRSKSVGKSLDPDWEPFNFIMLASVFGVFVLQRSINLSPSLVASLGFPLTNKQVSTYMTYAMEKCIIPGAYGAAQARIRRTALLRP